MTLIDPSLVAEYTEAGWWGTRSLGEMLRTLAEQRPDDPAYISPGLRTSWRGYDEFADDIAATLVGLGLGAGERVAVLLPDTVHVHAALIGTSRAGVVAVGIGARAGDAEIVHLVGRTGARVLVTLAEHRGRPAERLVAELQDRGMALDLHVVLNDTGVECVRRLDGRRVRDEAPVHADTSVMASRSLGPNDLFMLNSTSGTTGLPKCVTQFENRWIHFCHLARQAGGLGTGEILFGAVPAPFGFGLWTSHFAPLVLGAPAVVLPRFDVDEMVRLLERERVTVLCCVSTQFRMLLNSPVAQQADLSALRVMFTGGEAIPYDRATEFEKRTGATLLQFFGSNETGALSCTSLDDPREKRLATGGRLIPHMQVRLYDPQGRDVTAPGASGRPAGKGPLTCRGYYDDEAANKELFTPDGWMLMGDVVTLDEDGYLTLVGRTSDIIIRGGKNISAAVVEGEIETHPAVDLVAVVPVPDEVFGERVCAVVSLRPGMSLTLTELKEHLLSRAMSMENLPEHLVVVEEMPRSSGGKLAKGEVRRMAAESVGAT